MAYFGLSFTISLSIVISIAVPSIILAICSLIIYELWLQRGENDARTEQEYTDLVENYSTKSANIIDESMQEFLDAEKQRRYDVEENRLQNEIDRLDKIITALSNSQFDKKSTIFINKIRIKHCKKLLAKYHRQKDHIIIDMPYHYSEQFSQLRYSATALSVKEYKPNDTKHYIRGKRLGKYTATLITTVVGFNLFSPVIGGQNIFIALFMTILASATLFLSICRGYSHGYTAISVSSTGVYNTALMFINKAEAYCQNKNIPLYFISITENPVAPPEAQTQSIELKPAQEVVEEVKQISMNIFDNIT